MGSLTKEEIIQEIRKGSEIGKEILEIEIDDYKSLVKIPLEVHNPSKS